MSGPFDPRLAAVERRLARATGIDPAPALRHRVLMAVEDVLADRRPRAADPHDMTVPGWAWMAAAVVGVAIVLPVLAAARELSRLESRALAARLRAAGVADDPLLMAMTAAAPPPMVASPADRAAAGLRDRSAPGDVRLIDIRKRLEEHL